MQKHVCTQLLLNSHLGNRNFQDTIAKIFDDFSESDAGNAKVNVAHASVKSFEGCMEKAGE